MDDPSPSLGLKVQLGQMMLTAHCQKKLGQFLFSVSRGQAQLHNNSYLDHFQSYCKHRQLNYFGTCDDIDICQCVATHGGTERKGKTKKKWKLTCCQGFKVSRLLLSRHSLPNYDLLFTLSKICHKNRFTSRTDLSKLSKYDSPVSCFDTPASPSGWFSSNTARLNVSEVTQEPWLVDTLVTVWSKMARRFPAKRQTSELPWKQTASQTSRKLF